MIVDAHLVKLRSIDAVKPVRRAASWMVPPSLTTGSAAQLEVVSRVARIAR